ncbi:MAG: ATP synthase F1 subunit delta [Fuerstiella sp.]
MRTRADHVLEDPGAKAVASLYAQSYLDAAASNGAENPAEELHSFIDDVIGQNPDYRQALCSGSLGRDDVMGLLDRTVVPHCSDYFANFLKVLAGHGRLDLIEAIGAVATELLETAAGQKRVEVRSARALSDDARRSVSEQLRNKLGFEPILNELVDESLIGGLIIQVGDTVYDSSLRTRLKTLTGRLTERTFNEIQSGRDRFSHPEGD